MKAVVIGSGFGGVMAAVIGTVAAWLVNQVVRLDPGALRALVDVGERLHRAQAQTRLKKCLIGFQFCIHHPFSFSPDTCRAPKPLLFFSIHSSRRIPM